MSKWKNFRTWIGKRTGSVWTVVKTAVSKWWALDPFRQSAVIAYYAIFSLPALLVIIVSIAGFVFGADVVNGKIFDQIRSTMGADTAEQVKVMLAKASETKTSVWATVLGIITLLAGSIGVFVELQKTLNIIWEVEDKPKKGVWGFLRARVFSFGLILSIAFMLIVSLVVSTALAAASDVLHADTSKVLAYVFEGINFIFSLAAISFLFALMFKYLPDAKIKWREVWLGALVTGVLFTIGKTALAFYFGKADPGSGYGAAGSIVLILLWVSYSSMILFLGAEFTHSDAEVRSDGGQPSNHGIEGGPVRKEKLAQKKSMVSNAYLKLVPIALPVAALVNYALPFLIPAIIKKQARKYNATVSLKEFKIGLFSPEIVAKDLSLRYGNSEDDAFMVFASLDELAIRYNRKTFFKGLFDIDSFDIRKPLVEIVQGKVKTVKMEEPEMPQAVPELPIILKHFGIHHGKVEYQNMYTDPPTKTSADNLNISVNSIDRQTLRLATYDVEMEAHLIQGLLKSHILLKPGYDLPSFDGRLELTINLPVLNSFFKAYGKMDVHKGSLDVFAEVKAEKGQLQGYIKPLIKDLEILGPQDAHEPVATKVKEAMVALAKELLENQKHEQIATEIPIKGSIENPGANIFYALGAVGFNIFIRALTPDFKRYYDFSFGEKKNWATIGK